MQPYPFARHWLIRSLIPPFAAWKALLLLIALCSLGPGYDTSTTSTRKEDSQLPLPLAYVAGKLVRWDAISFVEVAARGYRYEQDWAWGWGFTRLIALCTAAIEKLGVPRRDGAEAIVAIILAHFAHLLSVLVLYHLTLAIFAGAPRMAITAAALHIISPAGLFLSAPYAESLCALLIFSGCLLFTKSLGPNSPARDVFVFASGVVFGAATTFRSNGLLSGILFLEEAIRNLYSTRHNLSQITVRRLFATGLGGVAVAVGFLFPQYIAYSEYCGQLSNDASRPWCSRMLPSIYAFVQAHYWNDGPFNYWTTSNVLLFILGAPMFTILTISALWVIRDNPSRLPKSATKSVDLTESYRYQVLRNLAATQLILAIYVLTTAHAQIVVRISSASPVWVWFLAMAYVKAQPTVKHIVSFMVIYAMVQAVLFASFLPPA